MKRKIDILNRFFMCFISSPFIIMRQNKISASKEDFMEKLKFILQSDGVDAINREVNYYIKDNVIKFKIDKTLYEYDLNKDILKKSDESLLTMDFLNPLIMLTLKENNYCFDIPIFNVLIEKEERIIKISYDIEEDKMTNKRIIIEY